MYIFMNIYICIYMYICIHSCHDLPLFVDSTPYCASKRVDNSQEFQRVTRLIHTCDFTPLHEWHDSHDMTHIYLTWCIHIFLKDVSIIRVAWHVHMCDMTQTAHSEHADTSKNFFFLFTDDTTHSYVWHHSFISVTWRIHM